MDATSIVVSREVAAPPAALFALLADPRRHPDIDGSAMVRGDVDAGPITAVGQVFRMQVRHPRAGDYLTDNLVTRFEPDAVVAWRTGAVDAEPPGWEWTWSLEPLADGTTRVSLHYDWSDVHDPAVLERVRFPGVPREDLEATLDRLAAAVA